MVTKQVEKKEFKFSTQISKQGRMRVIVVPKQFHELVEKYESKSKRDGTPLKVIVKIEEI